MELIRGIANLALKKLVSFSFWNFTQVRPYPIGDPQKSQKIENEITTYITMQE